jgi:hypothetical protein
MDRNILKNRQYYQNILYNRVNCRIYPLISGRYPIEHVVIKSTTPISELSLLKAHKYSIMKSFLGVKAQIIKKDDSVTFSFSTVNKRKIPTMLELMIAFPNRILLGPRTIRFLHSDLLIYLRRLDFYKVNLKSFTNVDVTFELKVLGEEHKFKWFLNEVFSNKRL